MLKDRTEDVKLPTDIMYGTSGLVSDIQLVGSTSNDIFAITRNDTSEIEIQRIIYYPTEPKEVNK